MFQLPTPPDTYVTNQIHCVSCQEPFVIAQDIPNRRGQRRTPAWRVPADQDSQIHMRYLANLTQRVIFPGSRAQPGPNPEQEAHVNQASYYFLNCPRCGADNRNWLNAQQMRVPRPYYVWLGILLLIAILLAALFRLAPQTDLKRLIPLLVFIALAGLLPLLFIPNTWAEARLRRYLAQVSPEVNGQLLSTQALRALLFLGICVVGVPILFYVAVPAAREIYDQIAEFEPPPSLSEQVAGVSQQLDERAGQGGTAVNPFDTLPASATTALAGLHQLNNTYLNNCTSAQFNYWMSLLKTIEEVNPPLVQSVNAQLGTVQPECQPEMIADVVATLNTFAGTLPFPAFTTPYAIGGFPEDRCYFIYQPAVIGAEGQATRVHQECRQVIINLVKDGLQNIHEAPAAFDKGNWRTIMADTRELAAISPDASVSARMKAHLETVEQALNSGSQPPPPVVDWSYLKAWFLTAGLAWLAATVCAYVELNRRISLMDPVLPQPIFTNLTHMTRVAVWEMKKTLEVPGDTRHIQWMRAERRSNGGVRLTGLHRSLPEFDRSGSRVGSIVRAQRYTIETDFWVRITKATIEDVEVPHTVNPAQYVVTESWSREYVPPLPPNGGGYLPLGGPSDSAPRQPLPGATVPPGQ